MILKPKNHQIKIPGAKPQTQLDKIRIHLLTHRQISSWQAIKLYRITRLAEYIRILRVEGVKITDRWINPEAGNRYKLYLYNSL